LVTTASINSEAILLRVRACTSRGHTTLWF